METLKIPRNENFTEQYINIKTSDIKKNFSVALSVKYKDNSTSALIFSPCVFQEKLRFHGIQITLNTYFLV